MHIYLSRLPDWIDKTVNSIAPSAVDEARGERSFR
jgi:hypothetical protein